MTDEVQRIRYTGGLTIDIPTSRFEAVTNVATGEVLAIGDDANERQIPYEIAAGLLERSDFEAADEVDEKEAVHKDGKKVGAATGPKHTKKDGE